MKKIKQEYKKVELAVNARNSREKGLLLLTGLSVIIYAWYLFLYEPMTGEVSKLQRKERTSRSNVLDAQKQLGLLLEQSSDDPTLALKKQRNLLRYEMRSLNMKLSKLMENLISPDEMVPVLRQIVENSNSVSIVTMENLEPEPLQAEEPASEFGPPEGGGETGGFVAKAEPIRLYQHGVEMTLQGSYFDVVEYLADLESLDKKIIWEALEYQVGDYPMATIRIRVRTLSDETNWIGV